MTMNDPDELLDELDELDPDLDQSGDIGSHNRSRRTAGRRRLSPRVRPRSAAPVEPACPDVYAWVGDWLSVVYAHKQDAQQRDWKWCPQWYRHPEAVARLEAAWRAWEALRLDAGTGASVWFRDHGDPCMRALTDTDGPFTRCSPADHQAPPDLRTNIGAAELRALAAPAAQD